MMRIPKNTNLHIKTIILHAQKINELMVINFSADSHAPKNC